MADLESDLETRVCDAALRLHGVFSLKLNVRGNTGWPDRLFPLPNGKTLYIEFKLPGEEPDARQQLIHAQLAYKGQDVQVHDNYEEALEAVRQAVANAGRTPAAAISRARAMFQRLGVRVS